MNFFTIADPGIAAALMTGRKTEMRVTLRSPLASIRPFDQVWVREACIPARYEDGTVYSTSLAKADLVIFPDGWRRHRDGRNEPGRPPKHPDYQWLTAMHMPQWASRIALTIEWSRASKLQQATTREFRAEGVAPMLGGLLWHLPKSSPRVFRTARAVFSWYWDLHHSLSGDLWSDDPEVVALGFRAQCL